MTASEFAFLALGLVLGVTAGAALIELLRARPPAPREIRVTVAPADLSSRGSTFASGAPVAVFGPARGGPGDRRRADREEAGGIAVRPPVAIAVEPDPRPDPVATARRPGGAIGTVTIEAVPIGAVPIGAVPSSAVPVAVLAGSTDGPPARAAAPDRGPGRDPSAPAGSEARETDLCRDERRAVEDRCAVADRLAAQAEAVAATLREAQRTYDEHVARAEQAADLADPRTLRAAKEAAQLEFRRARAAASSRAEVDTAARAWLLEINRINNQAREAVVTRRRAQAAADGLVTTIERLTIESDAARIAAESARQACLAAREALAACEEAAAGAGARASAPLMSPEAGAAARPGPAHPTAGSGGTAEVAGERGPAGATPGAGDSGGPAEPAIFRLLRGDRTVLRRIAAHLAGDDVGEQARWQLRLSDLVDAILARAIETSSLDFPTDHPFWGPFSRQQAREIAAALSSLGYRFDGLGGFADGRIPSQRDLSLAVGYAGLDPMRIRRWPTEAEMTELFREVRVAGDEYLAATAGELTLGEMVSMLGRRADGLTELWNAWGRLRPLLLATD